MATIGVQNLVFAPMLTDTKQAATYATPEQLSAVISIEISPQVNSTTLYADDQADTVFSSLGSIQVSINAKDIKPEHQVKLTGHSIDSNGVILKSSLDKAKEVAIGFQSEKSNGKNMYVWLLKGKFKLMNQSFSTKTDNIQINTPTLTADFIPRIFDKQYQFEAHEDSAVTTAAIINAWFSKVYEPNTTVAEG